MPKISVIVPIYNSEKHLEKCLISLINQELKDIEILLINDGSTDQSENIIHKFIKVDKRIKLLNQNNQGPGSARNNGIRNAKGDFIAFVDSDDYLDTSMLKCMYDKIIKDNSDIVICKYKKVNSLNEILFISRTENIEGDLLYRILTFDITPIVCNKLYSKHIFITNQIYFPEKVFYEDHLVNINVFFHIKKASFIDEAFYNWVERDNSRTESFSKKHIDDAFITLEQIKDFLIKKEVYDKYKNYFYLRFLIILEVDIFKKLFYYNTYELAEFTIQRLKDIDYSVCKIFNLGSYYNFIYNLFLLKNKYKILNFRT